MALKFVALLAFVASTAAGVISSGQIAYSAPVAVVKGDSSSHSGYNAPDEYAYPQQVAYSQPTAYHAPAAVVKAQPVDDYDPHPQYKFGYDVHDALSGDSKSQVETRDGDLVQGEYSLIDADGYKRTVQYTADSVHGFNAVVSREPINVAVKAVATPAIVKTAAPVSYPATPTYVSYGARSIQVPDAAGPVVKGAYAATPIVKATPVAYPISEDHHEAN